jgi:NADH:ubiquinone oxidoreductase subunit F (NADH-binding)
MTMSATSMQTPRTMELGTRVGTVGDPGTRLLAGPHSYDGAEDIDRHLSRLGPLGLADQSPAELRSVIAESGLEGRGGGQFPIASKLDLAARSAGTPLIVVNGSEGEPASRKDRTLLSLRPHLVLDGAMVAAASVGSREVVLYLHRSRADATSAVERAIAERSGDPAHVRVIDAPMRYVAGETSAVVSYLEGGGALPRKRSIPVAASGVAGRRASID